MEKIAELIYSLFQPLKLSARWVAFGMLVLVIVGIIYGYEQITSHFYFSKLEGKIVLLKELADLRKAGIDQDPELYVIYQGVVKEFSAYEVNQVTNLPSHPVSSSIIIPLGKAISGALLWIIVFVFGIASEIKKSKKITGYILGLAIAILIFVLLFAWIGTIIPTIVNPWVNYILFPLLQVVALVLLTRKSNNKSTNTVNTPTP